MVASAEDEKSYKFREDALVEKVDLKIEAKRQQRKRRVERRKRDKKSLEDVERKLQEREMKPKEEQELRRTGREEK